MIYELFGNKCVKVPVLAENIHASCRHKNRKGISDALKISKKRRQLVFIGLFPTN